MLGNAAPLEPVPSLAVGSPSDLADTQAVEGSRAAVRSPVEAGTAVLVDIENTVAAADMDLFAHTVAAHTVIDTAAMAPVAEMACTLVALPGCSRLTRSRNLSRIWCLAALAVRSLDRMFPDWWPEPLLERRIAGKISCRLRRCHKLCKMP